MCIKVLYSILSKQSADCIMKLIEIINNYLNNYLRRLTSKLACFQSRNIVNSYLSPHQLGVATKLGCEAAIHTTRTFVNNDQ
jgi:hypothetical protein